MHEAQLHEANCFVTLTYGRDKLPPNGSLHHPDFQRFMKRLRQHQAQRTAPAVRFYMCGEYGPSTQRPHYHANLFGVDFREDWIPQGKSSAGKLFYTSKTLTALWTHGHVSVQPLTKETAAYTTRYIMTKALGETAKTAYQHVDPDTGELIQRTPEYAAMSLKPGIGARWLHKYHADIYNHDYAVLDNHKHRPPRYYDQLIKKGHTYDTDHLEFQRQQRAAQGYTDNTPERRAVRETVQLAKQRTQQRNNI